eukprot:9500265-Pyramimonas_sp.AAC.1
MKDRGGRQDEVAACSAYSAPSAPSSGWPSGLVLQVQQAACRKPPTGGSLSGGQKGKKRKGRTEEGG